MEITEVRIKLMEESGERLQAFCSITFDNCFVIRDLKIIGGTTGPFVAMPSRRLTSHCAQCGSKNHLKASYCNQCGGKLRHDTGRPDDEGRAKLYADIAHPINQACRDMIQAKVIEAFNVEQERAKQPGYVSSYDDIDEEAAPPRRQHHPPRREGQREPHFARAPSPSPSQATLPPSVEKKKIEPASMEPPAPHTATGQPAEPKKASFGEGIL